MIGPAAPTVPRVGDLRPCRSPRTGPSVSRVQPAEVIVCVECGGRAHLLQPADPESPYTEGDFAAYRCEDCLDRWDLVLPDDVD